MYASMSDEIVKRFFCLRPFIYPFSYLSIYLSSFLLEWSKSWLHHSEVRILLLASDVILQIKGTDDSQVTSLSDSSYKLSYRMYGMQF